MQTEENSQWLFRSATPNDIPFIYSSWLKSYKHDSLFGKSIRSSTFFNNYKEVLDNLLSNSDILICYFPEDKNVILGYMVYSSNILHYSFVKQAFRRYGIARSMYNHLFKDDLKIIYTHFTQYLNSFIDKFTNFEYNPMILYKKGESNE